LIYLFEYVQYRLVISPDVIEHVYMYTCIAWQWLIVSSSPHARWDSATTNGVSLRQNNRGEKLWLTHFVSCWPLHDGARGNYMYTTAWDVSTIISSRKRAQRRRITPARSLQVYRPKNKIQLHCVSKNDNDVPRYNFNAH